MTAITNAIAITMIISRISICSASAVGAARLKADLAPYRLEVAMEALEKAEPATTLPVTLTLKDASGQPVKAEVSLALVDDAVSS